MPECAGWIEASEVLPIFPTLVWKFLLAAELRDAINAKVFATLAEARRGLPQTINFHDPRIQAGVIRPPVRELTAENTDQVVVRVTDGTLLMFPSYLEHSVHANTSEEERVSISFNLMFSSFTENLSRPLW